MKKIIVFILCFLFINNVYAIENIEINNGSLAPKFDKSVHVYNYFTSSDSIIINVKYKDNEVISGSGYHSLENGKNKIIVESNNNEQYIINVFKNYKKDNSDSVYLENLIIEGYEINFDKDVHEYYVNINDEKMLNISLELSNYDKNVSVVGNGNFNNSDNIININVDNQTYIIHAIKSINVVSIEEENEEIKEMSFQKKEIVMIIIITISCSLIFLLYYLLFIDKSILHI